MWTLEVNSVECDFAALGIQLGSCQFIRRNGAASSFTFSVPGKMDAPLLIGYWDRVIIRRDRISTGTTWTGGSTMFVGYGSTSARNGGATEESIDYELRDWWLIAEATIYHQIWKQFKDKTGTTVNYYEIPTPNVFLGVEIGTGNIWTNGQQFADAITWLNSRTNNIVQLGNNDLDCPIFSTEARAVSIAEVLRTMIAHTPDAVIATDYTTTPPTVNIRRRDNLNAVTITAGTDPIAELGLRPRPDLQVPVVSIRFKYIGSNDGNEWILWSKQVYPPNPGTTNPFTGAPFTDEEWELQPGGVITTIELDGSHSVYAYCSITAEPVQAEASTNADRVTWWKRYEKILASENVDISTLEIALPFSIKDGAGNDVSLDDYPNELVDGVVAPWMDFETKDSVTIKARANYSLYSVAASGAASSQLVKKAVNRELCVTLKLTNGTTGDYRTLSSFLPSETEPAGMAQKYYESLADLNYEGVIADLHTEVPADNLLGSRLTLIGTALTVEDQLIQEVRENLGSGRRDITIGPPRVLDLAELMDLHRTTRYRRTWNMPAQRDTGIAGGQGSIELGDEVPKRDTTSGNGTLSVDSTIATVEGSTNQNVIQRDAETGKFIIQQVTIAGAQVPSIGVLKLELDRLFGQTIRIREAVVCSGGKAVGYVLIPSSEVYTTKKLPGEPTIGE